MSDIQTFDQAAGAAAGAENESAPAQGEPADAGPSPVGAPAEQPAPPAAAPEGELSPGYAKKLQAENQRYRQQAQAAQEYVQAFSGWHPDDAAVIRQLLQLQSTDPGAAADGFLQIAAALRDAQRAPAEQPAPATMADIERYFAEREEAQAVAGQVTSIQQEATQLGFQPGTPGYIALLQHANQYYDNDLQAAAASLTAAKEQMAKAAIEEYLKGKQEQAQGAPPVAPEGAAGVPAPNTPKTFEEAAEMARQHLQ